MGEPIRASVILVTFNHRGVIAGCLDALCPTLRVDDEVILVDNASRDGSADFVRAQYPRVRVIRSSSNLGFGGANNLGAFEARGTYLVFLNPDTQPLDGWLDALLAGLEAMPGAGLATAKLLLSSAPSRIDAFGNDVHISGITPSRGWNDLAERYDRLEEVSAVSGACFAIRRQLFQWLGGFDERLFLYFEDTDLSLRARLAGYRCVAVPDAVVLHDHQPGFSAEKLRYLERNRWWTLLKLYEWRTLVALAPVLLLAEVIVWGMAAKHGPRHLLAKAQTWANLLRWLGDLPAARRCVRRLRTVSDDDLLKLHAGRLRFSQVALGPVAHTMEWIAALLFGGGRALARVLVVR